MGHAAERLDVVDDRWLAESPLDGRERRLDPRPASLPFQALDQAGLLAADVGARAAMQPDVEVEPRPVNVLAQVAGGACFGDGRFENAIRLDVFESQVKISRRRLGRKAGDQDPLDQLVGIFLHQQAIIERRRLALVGVDAHERFLPVLGKESPLETAWKAGAAATAELRVLDDRDHRVGIRRQRLPGGLYSPPLTHTP